MHVNFKQVIPEPKDTVGQEILKCEKLWILWFKIIRGICDKEELLELRKAATKMGSTSMELFIQEFDLHLSGLEAANQIKSPMLTLPLERDLNKTTEGNSVSDFQLEERSSESTGMKAEFLKIAKRLQPEGFSHTITPISSISKKSPIGEMFKINSGKRSRGDFEKTHSSFFEEFRSFKKREKLLIDQSTVIDNSFQLSQYHVKSSMMSKLVSRDVEPLKVKGKLLYFDLFSYLIVIFF